LAEQKRKLEQLKQEIAKKPAPKDEFQESVFQKKENELSIE
jgi:hypothetical protein